MDDQALNILSGLAQGAEKFSQNLFNIGIMKQKLKQEQETFGLDKKIKELEIKKAEYLLSPEQLEMAKTKLDAETKAQTALFNLRSIQMSTEETKQKKELDTYTAGMDMVQKFLAGTLKLPEGTAAKMGPFAITGKKGSSGTVINLGPEEEGSQIPGTAKTLDDFLGQF